MVHHGLKVTRHIQIDRRLKTLNRNGMLKSISVALICLAASSAAVAGPMTAGERQRLVAHFSR